MVDDENEIDPDDGPPPNLTLEDTQQMDVMVGPDGVEYLVQSFCDLYKRDITPIELEGILERYPYVAFANPDATPLKYTEPKHHILQCGWHLIDRTNYVVMGPGRGRWGPFTRADKKVDDEGGDDGGLPEIQPVGSLLTQGLMALEELLMVLEDRWAAIAVVGGHERLQRMAWHLTRRSGANFQGYVPNFVDEVRHTQMMLLSDHNVSELIDIPELSLQNK